MHEELNQEWHSVSQRANSHLRERRHINQRKHRPVAQLLVMPSFGDTLAVDIVRSGDEIAAYVTHWRRTTDLEAFASPVERLKHPKPFLPTYESFRVTASQERLGRILSKLQSSQITVHSNSDLITLDGTPCELWLGGHFESILLRWNSVLPREWSSLEAIVGELEEFSRG